MPPLPRPVLHGTALSPPLRPIAAARPIWKAARDATGRNWPAERVRPRWPVPAFSLSGAARARSSFWTRRTMPTDNPAGPSERQYADIVAYLLAANRFRAGATELGGVTVQTELRPLCAVCSRCHQWLGFPRPSTQETLPTDYQSWVGQQFGELLESLHMPSQSERRTSRRFSCAMGVHSLKGTGWQSPRAPVAAGVPSTTGTTAHRPRASTCYCECATS